MPLGFRGRRWWVYHGEPNKPWIISQTSADLHAELEAALRLAVGLEIYAYDAYVLQCAVRRERRC